jgi:hypothetical protein
MQLFAPRLTVLVIAMAICCSGTTAADSRIPSGILTGDQVRTTVQLPGPQLTVRRDASGIVEGRRRSVSRRFSSVATSDSELSLPRAWSDSGAFVWGICPHKRSLESSVTSPTRYALFRIDRRAWDSAPVSTGPLEESQAPNVRFGNWGARARPFVVESAAQKVTRGMGELCVDYEGAELGKHRPTNSDYRNDGTPGIPSIALQEQSAQSVRMFALSEPVDAEFGLWPRRNDRVLHVFDYEFHDVEEGSELLPLGSEHLWVGRWTRRASLASEVVGSFHALAAPQGDYLVVENEGLYYAGWKEGATKLRRIPLRDGELVQLLIVDADRRDAAFAFTSKYWFEVKEPLEYHEFELDPPKPDDPLPTLVRAAREVREVYPAQPKSSD